MHTDIYELPQLKFELDTKRAVFIVFTVLIFLVLPIYAIDYAQNYTSNSSTTSGSVAGAFTDISTKDSTVDIPLLNYELNLNSQAGAFIVLGSLLITISVLITMYLIFRSTKKYNI